MPEKVLCYLNVVIKKISSLNLNSILQCLQKNKNLKKLSKKIIGLFKTLSNNWNRFSWQNGSWTKKQVTNSQKGSMLDVLLGPESTFCFSNIKDNSKKQSPPSEITNIKWLGTTLKGTKSIYLNASILYFCLHVCFHSKIQPCPFLMNIQKWWISKKITFKRSFKDKLQFFYEIKQTLMFKVGICKIFDGILEVTVTL